MPARAWPDAPSHAVGRPAGPSGPKGIPGGTGDGMGLSALRTNGPDRLIFAAAEWPREESNLRARIRSPSLYPLSYGAVRSSVAASTAISQRREGG